MPGLYPDDDSDAIFNREDMKIYGNAIRILKERYAEKIAKNDFSDENIAFA